ncbi:MAG: hypothetical protein ACWA5U_04900 [bacterium]
MPRYLINLILLIFVLALITLVWFKPFQKAQPTVVSDLNIDDITRIDIIRPTVSSLVSENKENSTISTTDTANTVTLVRDNNQWQMTVPLTTRVNQARIRHLMTLLNEEVVFSTPAKQQSLADFDLATGKVILRFTTNTQQESYVFGMNNPMNFKRYLLKSVNVVGNDNPEMPQTTVDADILLASETVFNSIDAGAASFFSPRLLPEGIKLSQVTLPKPYLTEQAALQKWQRLTALYVASWDTKAERSQGSVELALANGEKIVFEILQTTPELWLGNHKLKAKYQIAESEQAELLPVQKK